MNHKWWLDGYAVVVKPDTVAFKLGGNPSSFTTPSYERYVKWLNVHVGRDKHDWIQGVKRNSKGFQAYMFRFKSEADAVMFKLSFIDDVVC